jgi:hypothetical protein
MGLTNLESLITSLIGFYTRRGYNGSVVTTANFVQLSSTSIPAQLVYVSNTTGKTLWVSTNGGTTYLALPDGAVFPFNNIADLSTISLKASDNTADLTVTFRYEI